MKILIAIIIFSAVVLFHELGHFLLAKKNHIVVTEFSLGMGPRLFSFSRGGTRYSVKLLPLGGSCAMLGEDMEDTRPGTFSAAPVWGRIMVVAAGPVFNFILAFLLSFIIVWAMGSNPPRVLRVAEGSAASEAGLKEGDLITSYQGYHVDLGNDIYVYSYLNSLAPDKPVNLTVKRDGQEIEISYLPDVSARYLLGFNRSSDSSMTVESLIPGMPLEDAGLQPGDIITGMDGTRFADGAEYADYIEEHPLTDREVTITYERDGLEYEAKIIPAVYETASIGFVYNVWTEKVPALSVPKYAFLEVKYMIRTTILSLRELFTGRLGVNDLSGPVGVVDAIGTTYEETKSEGPLVLWMNMLNMAVLLSANLGVMNLLPIPALDGGRLVFLLIEAIRRKPGNRTLEGAIHLTGLLLLMGLMVVIMYHDIMKLF